MSKYKLFSNNHFGGYDMSELLQESRIKQDKKQTYDYMWSGLLVDMEESQN
jgi:hypothetical protein